MKHLSLLITLFITLSVNAQTTFQCCGTSTVAPELTPGFSSTQVALTANVPSPNLAVTASTDLPNTEYLITKRNTPAMDGSGTAPDTTGGGGDVIIGSSATGVFTPGSLNRYGVTLSAGDTFDVIAIGYDLSVVKVLTDSLLNGVTASMAPCCGLFNIMAIALQQPALAGFCDSVTNAGVNGSSDVNDMNDVLTVFDAFSDGQTSVNSVLYVMQTINGAGLYISPECGGTGQNNFLPYGVNLAARYGYDVEGTIAVEKLSDVSLFMMYPNPVKGSDLNIMFTTTKEVDLSVNVYDALGQRVYAQILGNISGDQALQIPTNNLTSGTYSVELTDGYSNQIRKLVIQ
ncbi:MAG: T9SS type A sorting domain-containing protein [Saprospiraceae bacterium]|nr:T9SS type A sorting domain-containing protein [Saprospiraceae bacterium]